MKKMKIYGFNTRTTLTIFSPNSSETSEFITIIYIIPYITVAHTGESHSRIFVSSFESFDTPLARNRVH